MPPRVQTASVAPPSGARLTEIKTAPRALHTIVRDMTDDTKTSKWPGEHDALLVVDLQKDFLPGGALGVAHGDEVLAPLNRALRAFERAARPVYASRDWHPANHCSFKARGGPWPPHCIAGTAGAEFADGLALPPSATIVSKASTPDADAYSAFGGTDLAVQLRRQGVRRVVVGGLATDYCVLNTVLDARAAGFEVLVLTEAVRAVEVKPGDGARALDTMSKANARLEPA
jgi:nicotinamidase/pyrazinamidase